MVWEHRPSNCPLQEGAPGQISLELVWGLSASWSLCAPWWLMTLRSPEAGSSFTVIESRMVVCCCCFSKFLLVKLFFYRVPLFFLTKCFYCGIFQTYTTYRRVWRKPTYPWLSFATVNSWQSIIWKPPLPSQVQIRSDQSLSHARLFATPWITAVQASLSITNSQSSLRLMSFESVMSSSHLRVLKHGASIHQLKTF